MRKGTGIAKNTVALFLDPTMSFPFILIKIKWALPVSTLTFFKGLEGTAAEQGKGTSVLTVGGETVRSGEELRHV